MSLVRTSPACAPAALGVAYFDHGFGVAVASVLGLLGLVLALRGIALQLATATRGRAR